MVILVIIALLAFTPGANSVPSYAIFYNERYSETYEAYQDSGRVAEMLYSHGRLYEVRYGDINVAHTPNMIPSSSLILRRAAATTIAVAVRQAITALGCGNEFSNAVPKEYVRDIDLSVNYNAKSTCLKEQFWRANRLVFTRVQRLDVNHVIPSSTISE